MSASSIQAAIFDIGMVLLQFDFSITVRKIKDRCPTEPEIWIPQFWGSGLVALYDRGEIETSEFVRQVSNLIGFQGTSEEFIDAWSDIFTPNRPMIERVRRWKAQKMPLYLLSNTCEAHMQFFMVNYDIFEIFDGGTYSCREKLSKPDHAIYKRLLERHNLEPTETLFIDDRIENVIAAKEIGIQAIHYTDEANLTQELNTRGLD